SQVRAPMMISVGRAGRHLAPLAVSAVLLTAWGCGRKQLTPSAPRASRAGVDTLPPVPTSYIDVPVRYNLAPAIQWLETAVPGRIGDINERRPIPGKKRMDYAFALERQPFQVRVEGRTASVVAAIRYQ